MPRKVASSDHSSQGGQSDKAPVPFFPIHSSLARPVHFLGITFNEQRHEGDERRVQFGYCQPVGPVVS